LCFAEKKKKTGLKGLSADQGGGKGKGKEKTFSTFSRRGAVASPYVSSTERGYERRKRKPASKGDRLARVW